MYIYKHYIYGMCYISSIRAEGRRKERKCGKLAVCVIRTL